MTKKHAKKESSTHDAKKEHHVSHKKHHASHKRHHAEKTEKKKVFPWLALVVFVVLVVVVYFVITSLSNVHQREDVAAYVNGETITMDYLNDQYARIPAQYQALVSKSVLLNQTINEKILLQEAEKKGISVSPAEVQANIDEAMQAAGLSEKDMEAKLAEQNLSVDFLKDLYTKQMTINKLLEKEVFADLKVTKSEVEDEYNNQIHAAHILLETEYEAEDVIAELEKSNDPNTLFFKLAKEKSIDPSAKNNSGDLGEFGKGMMVPEFEAAAFNLDVNEFTKKPVKSQFGYHVILRLPKEKSLKEEGNDIYDTLLTKKKSEAVPPYVQSLRDKADIKVEYQEESSTGTDSA